ncbi:hypothetical protein KGM_202183 [Danaus plexippus plexippus]|uniref:Uncharacterized protein n=1 Tax=Danaus plexippus plexippus TaxID=278856 RepID=A0A212FJE8_DANPL|nr:hypothetical protein KGM_202183 [Danaus plexippus plexippus]
MKLHLFALLLAVTGSFALPRADDFELSGQRNPVEDGILRAIERIIARIQAAGADPFQVDRRDFEFIPITIDLVLRAFIENFEFSGASNIRIHNLEYSYIFNRLRLDVSLPEIKLSVGDSGLDLMVLGGKVEAQLQGSLSIKAIRLAAVVYVDVNIIDISLRSLSIDASLGGIESDLKIVAQGSDRSEVVNNLFNVRIPAFLKNNKADIDRVLESVISAILNYIWK